MSGHPLHGIKPLAKKERVRISDSSGSTTGPWKVLARKPGEIGYDLTRAKDESEARTIEQEKHAQGLETITSRI